MAKNGKPDGRPPLFADATVRGRLLEAIRGGNYLHIAARYAGIGRSTLLNWLKRGHEESEGPYRDLLDAITREAVTTEVEAVEAIRTAFGEDWRSAVEYLKRRHPKRWNRAYQAMEHTGAGGGPIQTEERVVFYVPENARMIAGGNRKQRGSAVGNGKSARR